MSLQIVPGQFPGQTASSFMVMTNTPIVGGTVGVGPTSVRSSAMRGVDLVTQPTLSQGWQLIGWSLRLRVATFFPDSLGEKPQPYAKFGQLLAGVAINANIPTRQTSPTILPADLSTFTEVWDPNDDCGPILRAESSDETVYMPLAVTYIFPGGPIPIEPGTQLQFALFMLPSLVGAVPSIGSALPGAATTVLGPVIRSAAFAVMYTISPKGQ